MLDTLLRKQCAINRTWYCFRRSGVFLWLGTSSSWVWRRVFFLPWSGWVFLVDDPDESICTGPSLIFGRIWSTTMPLEPKQMFLPIKVSIAPCGLSAGVSLLFNVIGFTRLSSSQPVLFLPQWGLLLRAPPTTQHFPCTEETSLVMLEIEAGLFIGSRIPDVQTSSSALWRSLCFSILLGIGIPKSHSWFVDETKRAVLASGVSVRGLANFLFDFVLVPFILGTFSPISTAIFPCMLEQLFAPSESFNCTLPVLRDFTLQ